MLFTVVIPAYNARDSIKRTIESLEKKQSCKDFEVVFVDDNSSDDALAVISSLRSTLKETTVIHRQNAGVFQVKRIGASMCKGSYILFLDTDDQLQQDTLLLLAEAMHPATQILFLSATRETKTSQKTNISPRHCRTGYTMAPSAKRHSSHNSSSPFSLIIYSQRLILTRGDLQQQRLNHIH